MSDAGTYSVTVRGRCLVAHSFRGECFGTAQNLHGITYTCDAEFIGSSLEEGTAFLIDIDLAHVLLEEALSAYDRTNLDDHADFRGENTTCERVARAVWERVAAGLRSRAHHYVDALKVLVRESDVAYVEYERALRGEASSGTYTVAVRGRCMCARSLPHGTSGQLALQGATFVVDALFSGRQLEQEKAFLIDICLAEEIVQAAVGRLHQQNLDDLPAYGRGRATSERVGERLWDEIAISLTNARHGREDGNAPPLDSLRVVVREHDLAAAEYAAPLGGGGGGGGGRFAVEAVGRCMLAHSFDGGGKVGGTFVLHARLYGGALAQEGCALIDRPVVEAALAEALAPYDRTDLDCAAEFDGEATTCERLSRAVWCRLSASLPPAAAARLTAIEVEVRESDVAGATFRRSLRPDARGGITLVLDIDDLGDLGDLGAPATPADGEIGEIAPTPTGIVHVTPLARLLAAIPYRLVAVSGGSARTAAERLRALGLERISWARVVTADAIAAASSVGLSESLPLSASGFWARLLATEPRPSLHPPSSWRLVNGAASVRAAACSAGVSAPLPAVGRGFAVDEALLAAVGCTRPQVRDAVAYLTSKREPDAEARSTAVVDELTRRLCDVRSASASATGAELAVLDLGAGTLSMLPLVEAAAHAAGFASLAYTAVESDELLLAAAAEDLRATRGFTPAAGAPPPPPGRLPDVLHGRGAGGALSTRITLRPVDARALTDGSAPAPPPPDLLVACAFADLLPPDALIALLCRLAPGALAYLPITFNGVTRLEPSSDGIANVPADARVTTLYHDHLRAQGQHIDVSELVVAANAAGVATLSTAPSVWRLPPGTELQRYLLDFLAAGTAAALWRAGYDASGWRDAALARAPTVAVENVDLLLRLPRATAVRAASYDGLEFVAPRSVGVAQRAAPGTQLAPGCAELRSVVSMVSTGTELLIYRGDFDQTDEPLDKTIASLGERIAYPMAYGYSLVGTVVGVGGGASVGLVGKLAFAFAPHAAAAFVDAAGLVVVPDDLAGRPSDAAFLPAAETAISIVHDAHPRYGEAVGVFGCGIIGLLVAAALVRLGVIVTAVDLDPSRRALARSLGVRVATGPEGAPAASLDVSIECSGSPRALQAAIDATRDGGTVVVASWYGRKPVALQLGTRFHRSHMRLIASQVSTMPGGVAATWSKARRFEAAWDLIRHVRPAATLLTAAVPLARAAEAYAALDRGEALVYHLTYAPGHEGSHAKL